MHRLAAIAGGWEAGASEGVIFIEQTPAPLVVLTAADTDIQLLAQAVSQGPESPVRVASVLQLQQQLTIDTYAETVLSQAEVILVRLLGGRAYWSYGLEAVRETVAQTGAALIVVPGDDRPDLDLMSHSTVPLQTVEQIWRYFIEGGVENYGRVLRSLHRLRTESSPRLEPAQGVPRVGRYAWVDPAVCDRPAVWGRVGLLFYRAHYLAGNTAAIDALCQDLAQHGLDPVPIFVDSLQDLSTQAQVLQWFQPEKGQPIGALINTLSFSLAKIGATELNLSLWQTLDVPVLQAICSGGSVERWQSRLLALSPRDMAMNVVLPEVDGRIVGRAISFKAARRFEPGIETEVMAYQPMGDRIAFMAELTANWVKLRQTPPAQRRIALILANYPTRDGRLANGVGLDTPASCVQILQALQAAGYTLGPIPADGAALIRLLTLGVTNDPEGRHLRPIAQHLSLADYTAYWQTLPESVQQAVGDRWGDPAQSAPEGIFPIAGVQLGHIFVGIQPPRGYDLDPSLNYHAPDLEPPHAYLAFYHWLRSGFGAQAMVHVGKHGNLEWLPGKNVALSSACFPEVALGPLPHLYPFIVNDPGEGTQAKRRSQAVIIDHLTPPLTRAELYGPLQRLEALIDEYYDAQTLDPPRLPTIRDRITALVQEAQLHRDLGTDWSDNLPLAELETFLSQADGYLCELKEAQIRDGLHILGQCPQGVQLRDLLVALARYPGAEHMGLTRAIALDWGCSFDPLTADLGDVLTEADRNSLKFVSADQSLHIVGDGVARIEEQAAIWIEQLLTQGAIPESVPLHTQQELRWMKQHLLTALHQTDQELTHLLKGLAGRYVPSGPSGAPTRGRADVLPTGRNFYSVDIRSLPTESAWDVGRKAAEALIERYTQEQGDYPQTLGLSLWGTAAMRTGGDDMAEALALLGVRPVWEGVSRRVIDFEILPLSILGRPRVDVTLRISGFFRDAFANLIDLFDRAVQAVANLDEPSDQNPLAAKVKAETEDWLKQGISLAEAQRRSRYRLFGSKPGAYGAGLQGIIEAQNWSDDADLARAYLQWSSYAYTAQPLEQQRLKELETDPNGTFAPEAFTQRLGDLQIVLHNQDNREHDLLDSDDYYQFQGGLTAAVRSIQGKNPTIYFGDHSRPMQPQIRTLTEELTRVYRSRVANPKWITGAMRHGYKGAFEMAATVDYLFAYDATTHCVADHMYAGVAEAYLFDETVQNFVQVHNPWALRDMAERLLEAHQRGLWSSAEVKMLDKLRSLVHQAEGEIEGLTDPKR
ncbi:MAG: cobaltochelatase subunit CobN [Thermosynechococcaceae cyanobacterium]